ncbi:MAG: DUF5703 domain-containing protein, partial [Chloroflexi bacterium]|nr:DUF5703 domain-containing protein [Chloroflexota bacterium]
VCEITAGSGASRVTLRIFVDAASPVVHVTGAAASPVAVTATVESWRVEPRTIPPGEEQSSAWSVQGAPYPLVESADVFPRVGAEAVAWYHRNDKSVVPSTLEVQSLQSAAALVHDPLIHRTFGGWVTGSGFRAGAGHSLETIQPVKAFALRVAAPCLQSPTAQGWLDTARRLAAETALASAALKRTRAWWRAYWTRARVVVHGDGGMVIPGAEHPLRIGYDSNGQNRFPGSIGRLAVYGRSLTPDEIGRLAAQGPGAPTPAIAGVQLSGMGTPREIPAGRFDFRRGFTVAAWILPGTLQPGRIFDRLTAGEGDGFLFDTYPGNTLRLIVGSSTLSAPPSTLKAGKWQNAAATVDAASGALRMYQDGKLVAEQPGFSGSSITRGYVLQRYVQACGGRGTYPIKFNGGIFTVEPRAMGKPFNADWRAWGDAHWWQNVRHMYHPMLAGGDLDMMDPLFGMYEAAVPLAEARTKLHHGVEGAYFPETMTVWGTYANGDYGWNRTGLQPKDVQTHYWRYAWNQGPELVALMLDRWDYSRDERFLKEQVLP